MNRFPKTDFPTSVGAEIYDDCWKFTLFYDLKFSPNAQGSSETSRVLFKQDFAVQTVLEERFLKIPKGHLRLKLYCYWNEPSPVDVNKIDNKDDAKARRVFYTTVKKQKDLHSFWEKNGETLEFNGISRPSFFSNVEDAFISHDLVWLDLPKDIKRGEVFVCVTLIYPYLPNSRAMLDAPVLGLSLEDDLRIDFQIRKDVKGYPNLSRSWFAEHLVTLNREPSDDAWNVVGKIQTFVVLNPNANFAQGSVAFNTPKTSAVLMRSFGLDGELSRYLSCASTIKDRKEEVVKENFQRMNYQPSGMERETSSPVPEDDGRDAMTTGTELTYDKLVFSGRDFANYLADESFQGCKMFFVTWLTPMYGGDDVKSLSTRLFRVLLFPDGGWKCLLNGNLEVRRMDGTTMEATSSVLDVDKKGKVNVRNSSLSSYEIDGPVNNLFLDVPRTLTLSFEQTGRSVDSKDDNTKTSTCKYSMKIRCAQKNIAEQTMDLVVFVDDANLVEWNREGGVPKSAFPMDEESPSDSSPDGFSRISSGFKRSFEALVAQLTPLFRKNFEQNKVVAFATRCPLESRGTVYRMKIKNYSKK